MFYEVDQVNKNYTSIDIYKNRYTHMANSPCISWIRNYRLLIIRYIIYDEFNPGKFDTYQFSNSLTILAKAISVRMGTAKVMKTLIVSVDSIGGV